jgi:hypothetical protein
MTEYLNEWKVDILQESNVPEKYLIFYIMNSLSLCSHRAMQSSSLETQLGPFKQT